MDGGDLAAATSLLEKIGIGRHSETPAIDDSDSDANEVSSEEGIRPRTVADLAKATAETSSGSSGTETFATVVKEVHDAEDDGGQAGAEATNDSGAAAQTPLQPVDPTTPGQKSVADQVFDALGGTETFSEAETEESLPSESGSHLNSPAWKGCAETSKANTPASTENDVSRGMKTAAKSEKVEAHPPAPNEPVQRQAPDEVPGITPRPTTARRRLAPTRNW